MGRMENGGHVSRSQVGQDAKANIEAHVAVCRDVRANLRERGAVRRENGRQAAQEVEAAVQPAAEMGQTKSAQS